MNTKSGKRMAGLAAALLLPGFAFSQGITVIVNGDPVLFAGVGPQQVNGRVLVPLRGIMEKLGAYVDYNSSTRTVTANKSGTDMTLRLGDRHAMLNGRDIQLDVPAQELRGSTMVPLRFVGEALGADVRWDAATYTVNIATTGVEVDSNQYTPPRTNPPTRGDVSITSFDLDHQGTIRGGQDIRLTLIGTPGGQATFSIPGVIQDVTMVETTPGTYVGTFQVPARSPINISKATAIARLRVNGTERVMQSGTALGFDTEAPMITAFRPDQSSRAGRSRPNISVEFDDRGGSGVDPDSIELRVDSRNVTRDAQITATSVSYRPEQALSNGTHEVTIEARDRAGNVVSKSWTFQVSSNRDNNRDFTYDTQGQQMLPGTDVTFRLVGEPGGQATFSVGDRILDRRMRETTPGHYEGTYTIRRNDNFANAPVTAKLVTASGDVLTFDAQERFNTSIGTLEAPAFNYPDDGTTIKENSITLRGTAAPGSRVQIKVDYSRMEFGLLKVNGTVTEMEVIADDRGRWQTESIDLRSGLGKGTTFNITANTVGANGKKSTTARLTLHR